jgi:peptide/nickel transport system substrate-binding protein
MRNHFFRWVQCLFVVTLLFAGCTSPAAPTAPSTSSEPGAADATTADEPVRVVVAQGSGVESWDPPAGWGTASEWIEMHVYDCLVFADRETGEIVGWLAESWENVDDLTWRMNLRQGVTFHNGEPFTAADAAYSINRIINGSREQFIVFDQWAFVDSVEIIDDYTIDIITPYAEPAFLSKLGSTGCGVVNETYVEEVGNDGLANFGIGTGPFKLVEFERESFVRFEANPDYWGGKPAIDELVFRVIPEASTRVAELLTGGVDITTGILPQDWPRIEEQENLRVVRYLTDRVYELTVAHTAPEGVDGVATSIPEIRQAISYAIDRQELVDLIGGVGVPTLTRLTPPLPCSEAVDGTLYNVNPFDPEKAKELMAAAGYPDVPGGPEIALHSTFGQYIGMREIAETIASMLEDVGFEVRLDILEPSTFNETVYRGQNEELMVQSLGNRITDPWIFILNYDTKFGERTVARTRHSFEEVDTLAEVANTSMDPAARCEAVVEYANLVAENMIVIPLFQMPEAMAIRSDLEWTPPPDGMMMLHNLKVVE